MCPVVAPRPFPQTIADASRGRRAAGVVGRGSTAGDGSSGGAREAARECETNSADLRPSGEGAEDVAFGCTLSPAPITAPITGVRSVHPAPSMAFMR